MKKLDIATFIVIVGPAAKDMFQLRSGGKSLPCQIGHLVHVELREHIKGALAAYLVADGYLTGDDIGQRIYKNGRTRIIVVWIPDRLLIVAVVVKGGGAVHQHDGPVGAHILAVEVCVAQEQFGAQGASLAQVVHLEELGVLHADGMIDVGQPVLASSLTREHKRSVHQHLVVGDAAGGFYVKVVLQDI